MNTVELPFMTYFTEGQATQSAAYLHILVILGLFVMALYGIYGIFKYSSKISKNTHLLVKSFGLIALIPVLDMLEHTDIYPGFDFWHHIHIFSGIIAFYFIYRFAMKFDQPKEDFVKVVPICAAFIALAVAYSISEPLFEDTYPVVVAAMYTLSVALAVFFAYPLIEIVKKTKRLETSFSLKSFAISMLPIISVALFLLCLDSIIPEALSDLFEGQLGGSLAMTLLFNIQPYVYMLVGMTLVGWTYMGGEINSFYAPIDRFLAAKGAKGTSKGQLSMGGERKKRNRKRN